MSIYNLIKYSNNYSETPGSLWEYYRHEPALSDSGSVDDIPGKSAFFKFKQKITDKVESNSTKNVDIMVPLKYLSYFGRKFEMQ